MKKSRIGKIELSAGLVKESWPSLLVIFENFVPVQIDREWPDKMVYTGYSPFFDEVEEERIVPVYEISIMNKGIGMHVTQVKRIYE